MHAWFKTYMLMRIVITYYFLSTKQVKDIHLNL
jgi:hypothetical protein